MGYRGIRLLGSCAVAALVAVSPARGGYHEGLSIWAAQGLLNQPRSVLALGEDCFLVQDVDSVGGPRLTCLRLFRGEQGDWQWQLLNCQPCPKDAARLFDGAKGSFLLLHRNGDLSRWQVRHQASGMSLECSQHLVDESLRRAIGLGPDLPRDCVELPDGALVLGYGWSVLHLVPAAPEGQVQDGAKDGRKPAAWRWLLRREPESGADTADTRGRGLLVAADGAGRVLVLDTRARRLVRIDPQTGTEDILATEAIWPRLDLIPEEVHGWRDTLLVGARFSGQLTLRTLVVLEPAQGATAGPFKAGLPCIGMDPTGAFAVTPDGHLVVAEPYLGGIRLILNADAPGTFFSRMPRPDQVVRSATGLPALVKPPLSERKSAPVLAEQAKAADAAFRELMEQEAAEARKRTKRARKKAQERRRHERARAVPVQPEPSVVTTVTAPCGGTAPTDPLPPGTTLGRRSASAPPGPVPPGSGRPWIESPGLRGTSGPAWTAAAAFGDWLSRQEDRPTGQPTTAQWLRDAAGRSGAALAPPATVPRGLGRFALSRQALERTVTWMLEHADLANPPREYCTWRLAGGVGQPRFSFGCYHRPGDARTLLEIRHLWAFARQIDADAGDALVTGELAAADGITGFRSRHHGPVQFTYGLAVVLGQGDSLLDAVQPWGAVSSTHLPGRGAASQENPPPTPEHKAPGPGPTARKSSLNPHAAEFVMPGEPAR